MPTARPAPNDVIELLERRRGQNTRLDDLLVDMADSLCASLGLRSAEWWAGAAAVFERVASTPPRPAARIMLTASQERVLARMDVVTDEWLVVWVPELPSVNGHGGRHAVPIAYSGELAGLLVVETGPTNSMNREFDSEFRRVVPEVCRRVGPLLHNARLDSALRESLADLRKQTESLVASRARVVRAADEERRRIERNLHDGLQQHLVALSLGLTLARQVSADDPMRADQIIRRLEDDLERALEELRAFAQGVYPPVLRDQGLQPVLAAAARRASLSTSVRVDTASRHAPDIEATVYFCCLEAISNACKHAGPEASVTVRVWESAGGVAFEVADDGIGFASTEPRGIGLLSIEDRVGALGGTLAIASVPGAGTRIRGVVPVET